MSTGSINPLSNSYLQSILTSAIQGAGLTTNTPSKSLSSIDPSSMVSLQPDNSRLSPFAQLMSELQQLQQTDPDKYKQVTGQIATNLQAASQTAQASGDTTDSTRLTQLSNDFTSASQSGQLPNVQDLAQAVGGHRHHHHHSGGGASGSSSTSTSQTQALDQILSAFQTNGTQSAATDPMSVIMSTLASAGITGS
jgi:hypothetical protein